MKSPKPKLAVIGAGISGLLCAREASAAGWDVQVFEKSRGVGGRMATRRAGSDLRFDHGAQYFTVRDEAFERYVQEWLSKGIVAIWNGRIVDLTAGRVEPKRTDISRYVAVPAMNAICKHLAQSLDVKFQIRITPPTRERDKWRLGSDQGESLGAFDAVLTSAPAPQSAELLDAAPNLQQQARSTAMSGCWAAMLSVAKPLNLPFEGAFVHDSPLAWIARNDDKPGRNREHESWVLHASSDWSNQNMEREADEVLPQLVDAFWMATGATQQAPSYSAAHRWRYAIPTEPLPDRCLFDPKLQIGACGDWCNGPRVEGAFLSGLAIAGSLAASQ